MPKFFGGVNGALDLRRCTKLKRILPSQADTRQDTPRHPATRNPLPINHRENISQNNIIKADEATSITNPDSHTTNTGNTANRTLTQTSQNKKNRRTRSNNSSNPPEEQKEEYLTEPLDRKPARQAEITLAGKY